MKFEWISKLQRVKGVVAILSVAACAVIGGSLYNARQEAKEKAATQSEAAMAESRRAEEEAEQLRQSELDNQVPELSDSQIELLTQIETALKRDELSEAAKLMVDYEESLWVLYYDILKEEQLLFSDGELSRDIEGTGMVLKKSSAVFYGTFESGKPEGEGTALQVIELDYPRYDYSVGTWSDGKLNGKGQVGYHYYEGAGEENQAVTREGRFVDDLMEGQVTYSTTNSEGTVATWDMKVEAGKLILDEAWAYNEETNTYQLLTNEDGGHAFVADKKSAESMMFQNMIPWE